MNLKMYYIQEQTIPKPQLGSVSISCVLYICYSVLLVWDLLDLFINFFQRNTALNISLALSSMTLNVLIIASIKYSNLLLLQIGTICALVWVLVLLFITVTMLPLTDEFQYFDFWLVSLVGHIFPIYFQYKYIKFVKQQSPVRIPDNI
jgi:FlaA1/EpsC-like NDP-sugar epimerase